jgi:HEAT repeat protein
MIEDIRQWLGNIESGTREEIWDAAKRLESLTTDTVLRLISLLEHAKGPESRAAAAYVLGFGRYASARTALEQVLDKTNEEASVRGHAAEALAYIQSKESVDVLLKYLEDKNSGVKYWCTFALGQIGDARAVPALEKLAELVGGELYEKLSLRAEALDAIAEIKQRIGGVTPRGDR